MQALTYDQALGELIAHRRYGSVSARGLLHAALTAERTVDLDPAGPDGTRAGVQITLVRGTAITADRYRIRDVTVRSFTDPARAS
jgi:hypothetical protein